MVSPLLIATMPRVIINHGDDFHQKTLQQNSWCQWMAHRPPDSASRADLGPQGHHDRPQNGRTVNIHDICVALSQEMRRMTSHGTIDRGCLIGEC